MNFVCIVFELGDKMLTLSSMENLIVQCNLKGEAYQAMLKFPARLIALPIFISLGGLLV